MSTHAYVLVVLRTLNEPGEKDYITALRQKGYHIEFVSVDQDPLPILLSHPPIVACFEYDYPDLQGLADLRQAKQRAASVPLLMITQAHSESLAVWAFRARVWDYFVQPVDLTRFMAVVASLYQLRSLNPCPQARKQAADVANQIPPEARLRCSTTNSQQVQLERAISYIEQHLHHKLAQAEVAAQCGVTSFQLSRLFRKLTGNTFQGFLLERRIDEAKRLLANPRTSITDVCFSVGFRDLSYFTRTFQKHVGHTPTLYRQTLNLPVPASTSAATTAPMSIHTGESLTPVRRPLLDLGRSQGVTCGQELSS
ncbi:MAG: DNA-binding response regulator [Halomonas sp.]|jgi:AraC-like DNA-binding protein/AmiR/NasT family two-component response regulator|uniref:Response regulator transcription factor n=1 Tax=Billgrantia tianxiuensis TaxID=2497861 RepID=A0A6I6SP45_9GAMM|nr:MULTISPECIES: DNA-binding response regulator [Halomonas]MCE8032444.1 DNA-binding response regulator [Halomonas sp. MCCC 1A11057]MDX5433633.1 DNA-binding response regulator [Halomonas sp.]QHC49590.1 response regulator transcription factor [Halomonas tianxiuensis]